MPRPCRYDPTIAADIVEAISGGASLEAASRKAGVPRTTVTNWIRDDRGGLAAKIALAKASTQELPTRKTRAGPAQGARNSPIRKAGTERTRPTGADPARPKEIPRDRFTEWLAANGGRLAAVRSSASNKCEPITHAENPARPEVTVSYTANRAAAVLFVNILGAVVDHMRAELQREAAR